MSAAERISPQDWLAKAERIWRPRLESAGLAIEVLPDHSKTEKAARAFGMIYRSRPSAGPRVLESYPAALVMAFAGVATSVYEGGKFWPGFWETSAYRGSPADQTEWGEAFLRGLRALGLPTFAELPKRYLGPLLMHAGIPNYCLQDYFSVLEVGMRRVGADADSLVQWAIPRLDTTFPHIDQPVRRFLQFGGEYAVDFVDQSLDALTVLASDSDAVVHAQLPDRVIDAARSFLAEDRRRSRSVKQQVGLAKPRLGVFLDPYAGEVQLKLPALEDVDQDLTWKVVADGQVSLVRARTLTGGRTVTIAEEQWRIERPTRRISVSTTGLENSLELSLVQDKDPLLFFQESGELLPAHLELPPEPVWVLYALPAKETLPAFDDQIIRTELPPLGWAGWHLALVDLSALSDIRLTTEHPRHGVRTQSRAALATDGEVGWVTMQGLPLQTQRPLVHLPDNITAAWRIRVTNLDSSKVVVARSVDSHEDSHDVVDPFMDVAPPLLGRFEVSVKGPFGRGVVRNVAIVEGLSIQPDFPWRSLAISGLEPLTLRTFAQGLRCSPEELNFQESISFLKMTCYSDRDLVDILVTPPAMAVATMRSGVASRWSFGHVRIHSEDVSGTQLLVRIQPQTSAGAIIVRAGERTLQTLSPSNQSGIGYAIYPLSAISDTVRANGACDLFVQDESRSIRVARVEPKTIASGADVVDGKLALQDFTGGDVETRIWSLDSPWKPHQTGHVDHSGAVFLREDLATEERLVVSWQRSDPWIPCEWPWMPDSNDSTVVSVRDPVSVVSNDGLDGIRLDDDSEANWQRAWPLLAMATRFPHYFDPDQVLRDTACLREAPERSMHALIALPVTGQERIELLIRSGAAAAQPGQRLSASEDELEDMLRADLLLGPLLVMRHLIAEDSSGKMVNCWRVLRDLYGDDLVSILTGKGDPSSRGGSFAQARWLARLDESEQESVIMQMRLVPKALLDLDSRTSAAVELFRKRDRIDLQAVGRDGRKRIPFQAAILRDWRWQEALELLEARGDGEGRGGWLSLSAQSAGFALVARLSAQGDEHALRHIQTDLDYWLSLAANAPTICTVDLVLAEAMALAAFSPTLPEPPFLSEHNDVDEGEAE